MYNLQAGRGVCVCGEEEALRYVGAVRVNTNLTLRGSLHTRKSSATIFGFIADGGYPCESLQHRR